MPTAPATTSLTTYTVSSGLTAGVYYKFKVSATNTIGNSDYSSVGTFIAASFS